MALHSAACMRPPVPVPIHARAGPPRALQTGTVQAGTDASRLPTSNWQKVKKQAI